MTREQAEAVQRMQDAIERSLESPIDLRQLAHAAGYSPYHAIRLFKELVGILPSDYLRARRLSHAARLLRDGEASIGETAMTAAFESHEGFTRAFVRQFGETPERYRAEANPIPLYQPRSARDVYLHGRLQENPMNEPVVAPVFVQVVRRPARKLIVRRGHRASGYWEYCEELGCDAWGVLASMRGMLDEPMGLWLPESLRRPGTSEYVMGVEAPADYKGVVPEGMDTLELPATDYLVFQGQPYAEEEMGKAITQVWKAIDLYRPEPTGWQWAPETAPRYQLAPMGERGYIEGRPVAPFGR